MTPTQLPLTSCAPKTGRIFYNTIKTFYTPEIKYVETEEPGWVAESPAGVTLRHVSNLNNMGICCNSWKRVGLINMKRAAGLVTPAKLNYSD